MSIMRMNRVLQILIVILINSFITANCLADTPAGRLTPGEKLRYELRWENVPAGEMLLEILPMTTIDGIPAYHFVMIAKSNPAVDIFCKIRDRIDAYADSGMTHSVYYLKCQSGDRKRKEMIQFDWRESKAHYTDSGQAYSPLDLMPGSFDPLSAFYFTRMMISEDHRTVKRPVTDGKRSFIGNAEVVGRETISLKNGKTYDTYCLEPDVGLFGGIFKDSKAPRLRVWVTADERRIPVQIKSKVKVGYFIGELTAAEGI